MGYTGGKNPQPWTVSDAPEKYIEFMQRNIVGIEIRIEEIQGKFKMSQAGCGRHYPPLLSCHMLLLHL